MFDRKNVKHYLLAISLLLVATYIGNSYKNYVKRKYVLFNYVTILYVIFTNFSNLEKY